MNLLFGLFFRTVIVYGMVVLALRLMGKRQIGELQPSELVVAIMISDLATMPMSSEKMPLLYGIVPIFTLVICEILLSFVSLKSEWIRVFLNGKPQILIKDGEICRKELMRSRVNIDDLMEELRKAGYFSLDDVDTVVLETGGSLSVIPSKDAAPLKSGDLNMAVIQEKIPYVFIADGKLRHSEIIRSGKNQKWIEAQLKKHKIQSVRDVLVLSMDGKGSVFIQKKNK